VNRIHATDSSRIAESPVFSGIPDVCGEVATLAEQVKRALDVDALSRELRREVGRTRAH